MVELLGALFVSAFLAATILPFSSEAALLAVLNFNVNPLYALIVASLGNVLAITCNYFLGYFFSHKVSSSKSSMKAKKLFEKYGLYSLFLTPLPIIGDPLTIIAGIFRINFAKFFLISATLRILRYILIIFLYNQVR
ncbi:MAG: VTT domain-containing protein [Campylobacterota bacterium]|nr:VTT domain-containing protein [Campylobacterota bacterium]